MIGHAMVWAMVGFVLGAAVFGALTPRFGAVMLVAAAYTVAVLTQAMTEAAAADAATVALLGVVLFFIAAIAAVIGHQVTRSLLRLVRPR
jgi:hypothetical protein